MQFGLWVNKNLPQNSNFLFDKRDCISSISKTNQKLCSSSFIPMGFWINDNLEIGNVLNPPTQTDYILSNHDLNYPLIKQIDETKLYKIK